MFRVSDIWASCLRHSKISLLIGTTNISLSLLKCCGLSLLGTGLTLAFLKGSRYTTELTGSSNSVAPRYGYAVLQFFRSGTVILLTPLSTFHYWHRRSSKYDGPYLQTATSLKERIRWACGLCFDLMKWKHTNADDNKLLSPIHITFHLTKLDLSLPSQL